MNNRVMALSGAILNQWQKAKKRDQWAVLAALLGAGVFLLYAGIYVPLLDYNQHLRTSLRRENAAAERLMALDRALRQIEEERHRGASSLIGHLRILQEKVQQGPFGKALLVNSVEGGRLHCVWGEVNFDDLMAWLGEFSAREPVKVVQAKFERVTSGGDVKGEIWLGDVR